MTRPPRADVALACLVAPLVLGPGCAASATPDTSPGADAPGLDAWREDASPIACDGSLELGLCRIADVGTPCVGSATEEGTFEPVPDGASATLVVGPQGSRMLVLAARTRGIEPGDPARPADPGNPVVEVHVTGTDGAEVASYRGRAAFEPDPADPTRFVQPEIFVIMEGSLPPGVTVAATLRDRVGAERCGRLVLSMGP
jgi:hypothetical protein